MGPACQVYRRERTAVRAEGQVDACRNPTATPSLIVEDLPAGHFPDPEVICANGGQEPAIRAEGQGHALLVPLVGEGLPAGHHVPDLDETTAAGSQVLAVRAESQDPALILSLGGEDLPAGHLPDFDETRAR